MKNRKIIKALGSTVLTASLCITGCSITAEKETSKAAEEETTTTETTEDPCEDYGCSCPVEDEDDEMYYSSSFQSTHGEIEGQMDYMIPYPADADWDSMPEDPDAWNLADINSIEDEDLRAIAQTYLDDGYTISDPALEVEYGVAFGDGEYIFCNGFSGYKDDGNTYCYFYIYKMNEELFDYYFVEWNCLENEPCTDDGTVIRYGDDENYVEFNRDTGIGVYFGSFDSSQGVG